MLFDSEWDTFIQKKGPEKNVSLKISQELNLRNDTYIFFASRNLEEDLFLDLSSTESEEMGFTQHSIQTCLVWGWQF